MTSVAIIVPVLGRPHRIGPIIDSVAAATLEPHRLLFVADAGDHAELAALRQAGADHIVVPVERRSWACKINDGYRATDQEWIFTAADDLAFRPGWFSRALAWADPTTMVIGTNDIGNRRVMIGDHSTHSLFRRSYADQQGTIDGPGAITHEGYRHQYADDEAVQTAKARGVYVHAYDAIVEHLHPSVGKADDDETYRLGREHTRDDHHLFIRRRLAWTSGRPLRPAPPAAAPKPPPPSGQRRPVVVTACYGGIDTQLHPQAVQDIPVDWLCFTDRPAQVQAPPPWKVVHAAARFDHPALAAKVHKATPTVDATDVIWIDASIEITSSTFVREALAARHDGVAAFQHPRRHCIYAEADASLGAESQGGKYAGQPLLEQVAAYRAEGHPTNGGLYACGVVAWDLAHPRGAELGRKWLAECEQWSWQDQLSFPVVARRLGLTPGAFPVRQIERRHGGALENRWLRIWPHTTSPADNPAVSVLVPYTSDDEYRQAARRYVLDWYGRHHPGWELIEGECSGDSWSKGDALADAARRATHDIFVLADADSIVPADILADAVRRVAGGASWVMPHQRVFRFDQAATQRIYTGAEPAPEWGWCRDRPPYVGVVGGGITVLTRQAWETVGGVDPRFVGWGGEDIAFGWALETLCGPPVRLNGPLFHLWHRQEYKGEGRRGSPAAEALANRYRAALHQPDAMRALVDEHRPAEVLR